jgi:hypothetical protein
MPLARNVPLHVDFDELDLGRNSDGSHRVDRRADDADKKYVECRRSFYRSGVGRL